MGNFYFFLKPSPSSAVPCGMCNLFFSSLKLLFLSRIMTLEVPNIFLSLSPNQQRTLNKLPTDLRCRNCVNKASTQHTNLRQTCKNRVCNVYIFQLSFRFAYYGWWLGFLSALSSMPPRHLLLPTSKIFNGH